MEMFSGWKMPIAIVFVVAIIGIFFQSFGWLAPIWEYFSGQGNDVFIIVVFVGMVVGVILWIFNDNKGGDKE